MENESNEEINKNEFILPIFPLEMNIFPGEQQLRIFEPRYKQMLDDCLLENNPFGICLTDPFNQIYGWSGPHIIGTTVRITNSEELGANHVIEIQGQKRFRINHIIEPILPPLDLEQHHSFPGLEEILSDIPEADSDGKLYIRASVELLDELEGKMLEQQQDEIMDLWLNFLNQVTFESAMLEEVQDEWISAQIETISIMDASCYWRVASVLIQDPISRQVLLETRSLEEAVQELFSLLTIIP